RQRFVDLAPEIGGAGQFLAVTKNRYQPSWHRAEGRALADQSFRDHVGLQRLVQPARPGLVPVAVADEGAIPENRRRRGWCHGASHLCRRMWRPAPGTCSSPFMSWLSVCPSKAGG